MTTIRDRFEDHGDEWRSDKGQDRSRLSSTPTSGYDPDENDPAWPSKSGQAD